MNSALDPMTFDELSELYRVEMRGASLAPARKDLFRAMSNLLVSLRQEYDRQMSRDPDSVMTEGADQRRKKAERLCKDIMVIRTKKIAGMAIRGAEGGKNALDCLADGERDYYDEVLELTRRQLSEIDRLRGRRVTVDTRIDEPPVKERPREPEEIPLEEIPMDDEPLPDEWQDDVVPEEPPLEDVGPVEPEAVEEPVPETVETKDETDDLAPELIRVLEDLPDFAGPDRDYSLRREDLVTLPRILADVLVNAGKAVRVAPTP